ncbi:MAG: hypothetical protein ACUVTQ_10275 [Desulfotomaculales bacterium]
MKEYLENFMKSNKPVAVAWLCWVGLFYAVTRQVTPHYYPYYALSAVLVLTVILTLRDTELSWVRAMVALTLVFFVSGA